MKRYNSIPVATDAMPALSGRSVMALLQRGCILHQSRWYRRLTLVLVFYKAGVFYFQRLYKYIFSGGVKNGYDNQAIKKRI